jgi:hypothetical protein
MTEQRINEIKSSSMLEIDHPRCEEHDFPMVEIDGRLECVAEYIDRCVGGQPVVDVRKRKKTVYYIFANGHQLPLLCSCCGTPLAYRDLEQARRDVVGRRLEALSINPAVTDDGREFEELVLELVDTSGDDRIDVPVAFVVAPQMFHPANCPHRPRSGPAKSSQKQPKKRRYRGLPGRN